VSDRDDAAGGQPVNSIVRLHLDQHAAVLERRHFEYVHPGDTEEFVGPRRRPARRQLSDTPTTPLPLHHPHLGRALILVAATLFGAARQDR